MRPALVAIGSVLCLAVVSPATAQTTLLFMHSQPGDYIGQGQTRTLTSLHGTFSASRNFDNGVTVNFNGGAWETWSLAFTAPQDAPLTPGAYELATRFPFQSPTTPGLDVSGAGRGCNVLTGRFDVFEVVYGPSDTVLSFAANFEQHCEGAVPALFGSIRYQAAAVAPHTVTVTSTGNGTVASLPPGIDCGSDCSESFTNGTVVALIATPAPGNQFAGWSGDPDCGDGVLGRGQAAACHATFEPCQIALSPTAAAGSRFGGVGSLSVITAVSCQWTATSNAAWLRLSSDSGTGPGTLSYIYDARGYFAQPRTAAVNVGGQTFTFTQPGEPATFSVTPPSLTVGPGAGPAVLQVTAQPPDGMWLGSSAAPWIAVPASGLAGAVSILLERNALTTSRVGSVTIAGQQVPVLQRGNGVPGEPVEVSGAVVAGQARIEWLPAPEAGDATTYRFEAGSSPGTAPFSIDTADATPVFTASGVPPGRYYVRVRGRNEFGMGPPSEEFELVVAANGMTRPGAPRNLTWASTLGNRLTLSWSPPTPVGAIDGYVLEVGTASDASNLAVLPLGSPTSFTYDGVPPGYYFLRVRAVNAAGLGDASREVLAVFNTGSSPPGPPTLLAPVVVGSTVNVSWLAPPIGGSPQRYRIEAGSRRGASDLAVLDTPIATTSIGFTGVGPGRYYVRVRGVNTQGVGPVSNEIRVVVP